MVAVPAVTPPIIPGAKIAATSGVPHPQVPPGAAVIMITEPTHTFKAPIIAAGTGFTEAVTVV
jgi:hypothetical protein